MRSILIRYTTIGRKDVDRKGASAEEEARDMLRRCTFEIRRTEYYVFRVPEISKSESEQMADDAINRHAPPEGRLPKASKA